MYEKEEKNSVGTSQMFCDLKYLMNELKMISWELWTTRVMPSLHLYRHIKYWATGKEEKKNTANKNMEKHQDNLRCKLINIKKKFNNAIDAYNPMPTWIKYQKMDI